jgi:hypothetical protein
MLGGYLKGAHKSMKASVPADPAEPTTPKPGISIGVPEKFLRWFAEIGRTVNTVTKHFLRPRHPASQFTAEQRAEDSAEEAGAIATAYIGDFKSEVEAQNWIIHKAKDHFPRRSPPVLESC